MNTEIWIRPEIARLSVEFEGMWGDLPIPNGLCRHAWFVAGTPGTLIDPLTGSDLEWDDQLDALADAGLSLADVQRVVWLEPHPPLELVERFQTAGISCFAPQVAAGGQKTDLPQGTLHRMAPGEILSLGNGRQLQVFDLGMPDGSWGALEEASGVFFTGNLFSSFGVSDISYLERGLPTEEQEFFDEQARLWWAAFGPFDGFMLDIALKACNAVAVRFGRVMNAGPERLTRLIAQWKSWAGGTALKEVCVVGGNGLGDELFENFIEGVQAGGADVNLVDPELDPVPVVVAAALRSRGWFFFEPLTGEQRMGLQRALDRLDRLGVRGRAWGWNGSGAFEVLNSLGERLSAPSGLLDVENAFDVGLVLGSSLK
ncbi:MAG: hypothetical protein HKM06_02110 [Spirochaetales bacterium]|nr:hypothetical protein [Spirochaetales bacterium]